MKIDTVAIAMLSHLVIESLRDEGTGSQAVFWAVKQIYEFPSGKVIFRSVYDEKGGSNEYADRFILADLLKP